jgi:hypothetical protein
MRKVVWSAVVMIACLAGAGTWISTATAAFRKDEWKGQARAFDRLDANHDGALSPQELRRAMRRAAVRRRR